MFYFTFQRTELNEKFNGFIPIEKLDITYSASSGPGGQNVNKVRQFLTIIQKKEVFAFLKVSKQAKDSLPSIGLSFIHNASITKTRYGMKCLMCNLTLQ